MSFSFSLKTWVPRALNLINYIFSTHLHPPKSLWFWLSWVGGPPGYHLKCDLAKFNYMYLEVGNFRILANLGHFFSMENPSYSRNHIFQVGFWRKFASERNAAHTCSSPMKSTVLAARTNLALCLWLSIRLL
jgi:hypothetical protein